MPNDAPSGDFMTTLACLGCRTHRASDSDPEMVQIHAAFVAARVLELCSRWDRSSAGLVNAPPSCRHRRSRRPLTMPAGIALDPLAVPTAMRHGIDATQPPAVRPLALPHSAWRFAHVVRLWCLLWSMLLRHVYLEAQARVQVASLPSAPLGSVEPMVWNEPAARPIIFS